jgi:hypothetical protein
MHQGNRQPIPPVDPHHSLLAVAYLARLGAPDIVLAQRPVRHHPTLLIKVAGRVTEMITRIKIALPTAYPYQIGFATLVGQIAKLPP